MEQFFNAQVTKALLGPTGTSIQKIKSFMLLSALCLTTAKIFILAGQDPAYIRNLLTSCEQGPVSGSKLWVHF